MTEPLDKLSFTREDLLNHLPVLEGLYKCFDKKQVTEWMLKKYSVDTKKSEPAKQNEG